MDLADSHQDFPAQFARTRRFSLGTVRHLTVSPDGERVLFVRSGGGTDPVGRLWLWEAGRERLLADPYVLGAGTGGPVTEQERARRERARDLSEGVSVYTTDASGQLVVFALGGLLWTVRTDGSAPVTVPAAGPVTDPRPSPDGRRIAYVTGGALRVVAPDGSGDRLLAGPENAEVTYGLTDYISAEEMGRTRGFWWAPDSTALLVARVDTTGVARRWLSDPARPQLPPRVLRYPRAGTANAEVSLHLISPDGPPEPGGGPVRREVRWDRGAFEYLTAAGWDGHGPLAAVQSRDQRTLRVLAVDPDTGSTRILHEQRDRDWVELLPGTPCRTASGALVHPVESEDTRRLRVGAETVTPPGLQLSAVLGTDGEDVLFTASDDPVEEHVWRYSPGAGCVRLSERPGVHRDAASGGGTTVLDGLTEDGQQVTVLRDSDREGRGAEGRGAERRARIRSLAEAPAVLPRPEFLTLGERRLRAALFLPSGYASGGAAGGKPLPVLLNPYSGPGVRLVLRARHWHAGVSQWFAEQGFAVLVTDGRGTPGRGPAWEKTVRGDQLTPVLEDQADALRAAADARPGLDLGRVAIRGWSFGGTLATAAVLRHPDIFHAAVSGAGPTDQRLYDTHWKERFLGHPDQEPENYDRNSLLAEAPALSRPLLLVHGLADDNVAVAHTLRFSAALLAAGREHSVLPLSGASHLVKDETTGARLLEAELRFLRAALCR